MSWEIWVLIILIISLMAYFVWRYYPVISAKRVESDWAQMAEERWQSIEPKINRVREVHTKAWTEGKKIGWPEKKTLEWAKSQVTVGKMAFDSYVGFCNLHNVEIPSERQEYSLVIEEANDALDDPKHALDNALERAKEYYDKTYELVSNAGEDLYSQRQATVGVIENIEDLINSIAKRPKSFEKDFEEIRIYKEQFKGTVEFALEQKKAIEKSAKGAGAGVAAGGMVAGLAPNAAMWVATTFGTASTGTAISALSGAAAQNAALAWLGGGALTASGGGMAAGQALLALAGPVGWGIAGTSILASVLLVWRKKQKIAENKKNEVINLKQYSFSLRKLKDRIRVISIQTSELSKKISKQMNSCQEIKGCDYTQFSEEQKQLLGALVNNTKALAALLCAVIE